MRDLNPPPIPAPMFLDEKNTTLNPNWMLWFSTVARVPAWNAVSSFSNSWVSVGAPYHPVGFHRDVFGVVRLRGRLGSGSTGNTAFTLPVNFRPGATQGFAVSGGTVSITTAGVVTPTGTTLDLDGISFISEA